MTGQSQKPAQSRALTPPTLGETAVCHFIHIAVPIAHAAWFRQQSWPHFSHAPVECTTKHRFAQHARSWAFHAAPKTGCSCGSYSPPRDKPPANRDNLIARYLAKGWSHAKAQRAADQSLRQHRTSHSPAACAASSTP